jgi:hypothetical protein
MMLEVGRNEGEKSGRYGVYGHIRGTRKRERESGTG